MGNLLTFGCSLTYDPGVKERLSELLGYNLISYAQMAGSNGLQINRFHERIFTSTIDTTDIVYWQITSPYRNAVRLYPYPNIVSEIEKVQEEEFAPTNRYHFVKDSYNVFDKLPRYDMLCNSPWSNVGHENFDLNDQLQNIVSNIVLCSKIYPKTLVVYGWKSMFNDAQLETINYFFDKHNVHVLDTFYLDWVVDKRLNMWDNDCHPDKEAGAKFAEEVVYPKMKELNFI